jgi:DNA repair protein RadD
MSVTLRPHQIAAADAVEDAFRRGVNKPLVDMCVGAGKSLVYAELARREIERGGRAIIGAHTRELVKQNANACRMLGLPNVGINAEALGERTWRAQVISASIQSVHRAGHNFGPISLLMPDEAHLLSHGDTGMYHRLYRALNKPRMPGGSGTVFRMQGGSLVEGENAPFDEVVFRYSIMDGIRDGYLVPPYSETVDDKIDPTKLRTSKGEFTGESQDAQMLALMDNHIAQMVYHGQTRRSWLIFEASDKAVRAMAQRLNEWGIPTGFVLASRCKADDDRREQVVEAFRAGRLRALVGMNALTTGFDVQEVDMLVCRRRTKSLGLWIQIVGRLLRTIGGNIRASIAAGKPDGILLDYAGNVEQHGPLDFIRPIESRVKMVSCESCGTRNPSAASKCWKCEAPMMKRCPACLEEVLKGVLDCPHCGYDMRKGTSTDGPKPQKLLDRPSGAALIRAWSKGTERAGGWLPIRQIWRDGEEVAAAAGTDRYVLAGAFADRAADARWLRADAGQVTAILVPNGSSRNSARQVTADGAEMIVPLPAQIAA